MKPMDVVMRAPEPADAAALARMHYAAWREAYAPLLPADFFSDEAERAWGARWEANLATTREDVVSRIAVRDGAVVGFATAGPARANDTAGAPARDREPYAMSVRAAEYGSGLAAALLTAVLPEDVPAELWVFEANPRARAFSAKHGFAPDGARHVFGPEYGNQAEVRLVR